MSKLPTNPDARAPVVKSLRWLGVLPFLFGCVLVVLTWQRFRSTDAGESAQATRGKGPRWNLNVPPVAGNEMVQEDVATSPGSGKKNKAQRPAGKSPGKASFAEADSIPDTNQGNQPPVPVRMRDRFISNGTFQMPTNAGVAGRITLDGTPEPEQVLRTDTVCGPLRPTPRTRDFVVDAQAGLADVFVQIRGLAGLVPPGLPPAAMLVQSGCDYSPHVLSVQAGQKILVRNSDPVLHSVHAVPGVEGNREQNLAQLAGGADLEFAFASPEAFLRFKCDLHPAMTAYVCVADSPWFAVTDANGRYRLPPLPPGYYVIEAHHRKAGSFKRRIRVLTDRPTVENIVLTVPLRPKFFTAGAPKLGSIYGPQLIRFSIV